MKKKTENTLLNREKILSQYVNPRGTLCTGGLKTRA